MTESCPLPVGEEEVWLEDIPHECRQCLQIVDSNEYDDPDVYTIGLGDRYISREYNNSGCEHDSTYPVLWVARPDAGPKREVEIAGYCEAEVDFSSSDTPDVRPCGALSSVTLIVNCIFER